MSLNIDNFRFDITARGPILPALEVALLNGYTHAWTEERMDDRPVNEPRLRLILWSSYDLPDVCQRFLGTTSPEGLSHMIDAWLEARPREDRGRPPDHDGDNVVAWRIYNEAWGMVGGDRRKIVAIEPTWGWVGK